MKIRPQTPPHLGAQGPTAESLGQVAESVGIRSSMGPFLTLQDHRVRYPAVVIEALRQLYVEYNHAFAPLVASNTEWAGDYQHCLQSPQSTPQNWIVQVDMIGLGAEFLASAADQSVETVREALRHGIFEIENSVAVYQILQKLFARGGISQFNRGFRAALEALRQRFGMPIALLAVTNEKYEAMSTTEFGKNEGEGPNDDEVMALSGFDHFFSPTGLRDHLTGNGGRCDYLLYVRSSDPVAKLRKPSVEVVHPLLSCPDMRRVIKAHALTFNVDDPQMDMGRRINDSKGYMEAMGMGMEIADQAALLSPALNAHLEGNKGGKGKSVQDFSGRHPLSQALESFLQERGLDPAQFVSGQSQLRAKPLKGSYGCYGHLSGTLTNRKFRSELRRNISRRGPYVVQPELVTPQVTNLDTGVCYQFIDRVFLSCASGQPQFIGGFRSMMPTTSEEGSRKRNHGNRATVYAEITT